MLWGAEMYFLDSTLKVNLHFFSVVITDSMWAMSYALASAFMQTFLTRT